jgi:hypothetical protein
MPIQENEKTQSRGQIALILLLGVVSLLAISATPFLDLADQKGKQVPGISEEFRPFVIAVPAGTAFLGLLALGAGLLGRRFGFPSLFLLYLTSLISSGLLFLALFAFREQWNHVVNLRDKIAQFPNDKVVEGVDLSLRPYLWVGLVGAILACLSFVLATVVIHRRFASRLIAFFFLGGVASLGAVWIYWDALEIYFRF